MILCLDVGNSHVFGGVVEGDNILLRFRYASHQIGTSDQYGLFLRSVLRENSLDPDALTQIAICSVVPELDYSITSACIKYFNITPFMVKPGIRTGLQLKVKNTQELGADRITNAIASCERHPNCHKVIIDFGTATTFCAVTKDKVYLGGVIMPGLNIGMQSLATHAAKLASVEITKSEQCLGRTTKESIQSGLFYGQLGAARTVIECLTREVFSSETPKVIATGGFAHLFSDHNLYDVMENDLVLHGLAFAWRMNQ